MRVVDDHRELLSFVDRLEPPGNTVHRLDPALDRFLTDAERAGGECGADRIQAVEAAAQLQLDAVEHVGDASNVIASGSSAPSRRPYSSPTLTTARRRLLEERALRGVVRLHRAVEVQMVLREVREYEHVEPRPSSRRCTCAIDVASITHA